MKRIVLLLQTIFLLATTLSAQPFLDPEKQQIRKGNRQFREEAYDASELAYRQALEINTASPKGIYNLGDALYEQERFKEAAEQFKLAAELSQDPVEQAQAWHNLGNTHLQQKQYPQAIEAYKKALRRNPSDMETKYNLAYAQKMLDNANQQGNQDGQQNQDQDKNQEQDQQNQDQQNNQNQEDQEQNKDQQQGENEERSDQEGEKQEGEAQEQQPNEGEGQDQEDQGQSGDQPEGEPREGRQLSQKEIEQMLQALRFQEEKLQAELQKKKVKGKPTKSEKDW